MMSSILKVADTLLFDDFKLDFIGSGNIWIHRSQEATESINLTKTLIAEGLEQTCAGQLEIVIFDEQLDGVGAPFLGLNRGGDRIIEIITNQGEFREYLKHLRVHISNVQNVIGGRADTLSEFRAKVDYPIEHYKLVVLSCDYSLLAEDIQNELFILFRVGPRAGVSFLVHSVTIEVDRALVSSFQQLHVYRDELQFGATKLRSQVWHVTNEQLLRVADTVADGLASQAKRVISFNDVQPSVESWVDSSVDGLSFSIGKYGLENSVITIGDELNQRHNVLVTGAVGQGKSNLLAMIVHSLCMRYSPRELALYMLDFKEGVSLQAYAPDGDGAFLPHARALGLDADREYGYKILKHLYATYESRMAIFKHVGAQNIRTYRQKHPEAAMPRIVLLIDEFQILFGEDDLLAKRAADLMTKAVRLFRSAGIHIILCSQTLGGNLSLMGSKGDGLFSQVPIRIALKNSVTESYATLSPLNDAAAHLKTREAIVNLDYGLPHSNQKTSVAFADEEYLAPLRKKWWLRSKLSQTSVSIFDGSQKISYTDSLDAHNETSTTTISLGKTLDVSDFWLNLPFSNTQGRNVAIFGTGPVEIYISNVLASLISSDRRSACVIFNVSSNANPAFDWSTVADRIKMPVAFVPESEFSAFFNDFNSSLSEVFDHVAYEQYYVIVPHADQLGEFSKKVRDVLSRHVSFRTQFIAGWSRPDAISRQIDRNWKEYFDVNVFFKLDTKSIGNLLGNPLLKWRHSDNRVLVWDRLTLHEPVNCIPFSVW